MRTLLVVFILAFFAACNNGSDNTYKLSLQETLEKVSSKADILTDQQVADIILSTDENIKAMHQFVDIRTPAEFNVWHVPAAVNMPAKDIFSDEYKDLLANESITKVLYCKGSHQAMNTYVELIQHGYKNIKVSLGGYQFIREHIIDTLDLKTGIYNEDAALYDYAKVVKETAGAASANESTSKPKPAKTIIKRKKKEVEGGCG